MKMRSLLLVCFMVLLIVSVHAKSKDKDNKGNGKKDRDPAEINPKHHWVVGPWLACSVACSTPGNIGIQHRNVTCRDGDNVPSDTNNPCDKTLKQFNGTEYEKYFVAPPHVQPCNTLPCPPPAPTDNGPTDNGGIELIPCPDYASLGLMFCDAEFDLNYHACLQAPDGSEYWSGPYQCTDTEAPAYSTGDPTSLCQTGEAYGTLTCAPIEA